MNTEELIIELKNKLKLAEELEKENARLREIIKQHGLKYLPDNKDVAEDAMQKLLLIPISDLCLSVRVYNCLYAAHVKTLRDLLGYSARDLTKLRNFGRKSLNEVEVYLERLSSRKGIKLSLGMYPMSGICIAEWWWERAARNLNAEKIARAEGATNVAYKWWHTLSDEEKVNLHKKWKDQLN